MHELGGNRCPFIWDLRYLLFDVRDSGRTIATHIWSIIGSGNWVSVWKIYAQAPIEEYFCVGGDLRNCVWVKVISIICYPND